MTKTMTNDHPDNAAPGGKTLQRLSPGDQPQDRLYEMCLRFTGDAGLKEIDDMLSQCFPGDGLPRLKDAVSIKLKQVVSFIPDDEALAKYAETIQAQYAQAGCVLDRVRFDGYEYLYAVKA